MDVACANWCWAFLFLCGFVLSSPAQAADDAGTVAAKIVKEAKALREAGQEGAADKKLRDAAKSYEDRLQQQPDDAQAHFALAQLQLRLDQRAAAKRHLERAMQLEPNHAAMYALKGKFHGVANEHAEADKSFRRSLELDPQNTEARMMLAMCLVNQDETDEALSQAREVLKLAPNDSAVALFFVGLHATTLFNTGKYEEWEQIVRSALNTQPRHKKVLHEFLVSGFVRQQRYEKAYRESLELQKLDPEDTDQEEKLVVLATQARQPALAATHIERLREFRRAGKIKDTSFARDEFFVGRKCVSVGEYFELKDHKGTRFSFGVFDDTEEQNYFLALRNSPDMDAHLVKTGKLEETEKRSCS